MHALLTWDPRADLTHSKYVCKHVLWVFHCPLMPYYMGLDVSCVYMSQYWHVGHFPHFSCAPRAEVLKMLLLYFRPELILIIGLKALGCFHAKSLKSISLGNLRYNFWGTQFVDYQPSFWPLCDQTPSPP